MQALRIEALAAGYGGTEVLHGLDLQLEAGRSLCLIGPNGAGKSTVLNAIFGFADITRGRIFANGRDVTRLRPDAKLRNAGIAYVLQDSSVFPDLSVEHNIRLGAYLMRSASAAGQAVERIFKRYPLLAERRGQPARVLSGGERRLLEISRALMMDPRVLLLDEPTIGLEPRLVDMIFALLRNLQDQEGKTILLVEQNARKGLEFADVGCALVSGRLARTGTGRELLQDPSITGFFLGE
jgi:branched-chain amino acid transport system ATP-binding protein